MPVYSKFMEISNLDLSAYLASWKGVLSDILALRSQSSFVLTLACIFLAWLFAINLKRASFKKVVKSIFGLNKEAARDWSFWFFNECLLAPVYLTLKVGRGYFAYYTYTFLVFLGLPGLGVIENNEIGLFISFLLVRIAMYDLTSYIVHYAFHYNEYLWQLHRVHHERTSLNFMASLRFHPLERVVSELLKIIIVGGGWGVVIFLGGGLSYPLTFALILVYGLFYLHSPLRHTEASIDFGVMDYIFTSPFMHQLHHCNDRRYKGKNLAPMLSLWDWLFGTLELPTKEWKEKGIEDGDIGIVGMDNIGDVTFKDFLWVPIVRMRGVWVRRRALGKELLLDSQK